MKTGEYIRKLRTDRGWSQEELGKKVGVNRAAVNKWESGAVENIKRSTIKKLSEVFGVSPCDLMCWNDDLKGKVQALVDPDALDLLQLFEQLDQVDRERIRERIMTMLESEKYQKNQGSCPDQKIC